MKSGKNIFRPRSRMIKALGDELISNEFVAISELVKNSYDAGASFVNIDIQKNTIVISDDGKGMNLEELQKGWFEPATNIKAGNNKVLGEKGIGRFSVVKLAKNLELMTKSKNNNGIVADFNWEAFNKDNSYLDEIEVSWKEFTWNGENVTGTTLVLEKLKNDWRDQDRVKNLETFLSRMVSPFDEVKNFKIQLRTTNEKSFREVETNEVLKHPDYLVTGNFIGESLSISYKGLNKRKKEATLPIEGDIYSCGDFSFQFRIWDRDVAHIKEYAEKYGTKAKDVRALLDGATGISVYRDSFRVLPYGEETDDWLRLDARKVQNPSKHISNNQIIGYIQISKECNPNLKDKTNREGIIESPEFTDLRKNITDKILNYIEAERFLDRAPKRKEITNSKGDSVDLTKNRFIDKIEKHIDSNYPTDKKLVNAVKKAQKEDESRGKKFEKLILQYRRLSTLGQLLETVIHEINNSFAKVSTSLSIAVKLADDKEKVIEKIMEVKERQKLLQKFVDRLKPFAERTSDRSSVLSLKKEISNTIEIEKSELEKNNITVNVTGKDFNLLIRKVDLFSIFSNLIDNSIYWLKEVNPKEGRKISIKLEESDSKIMVLFSDNGPGVEEDFKQYIFDPYFSKKVNGTGLGLSIIGEIVSDYDGIFEYYEDGDLAGAAFKITFNKK